MQGNLQRKVFQHLWLIVAVKLFPSWSNQLKYYCLLNKFIKSKRSNSIIRSSLYRLEIQEAITVSSIVGNLASKLLHKVVTFDPKGMRICSFSRVYRRICPGVRKKHSRKRK